MTSTIGVSSIYRTPSFELCRRKSSAVSLPASEKFHHFGGLKPSTKGFEAATLCLLGSLRDSRNVRLFIPRAVATPNPITSGQAFKGIEGLSQSKKTPQVKDENEGHQPETRQVRLEQGGEDELSVANLGLPRQLVESLEKRGITHLFPIQRAVLRPALEGRDIIARAKTGTGKTLAFGIPIIKCLTVDGEGLRLSRRLGRLPRGLILAPTRELAKQVEKEIKETAPYLSTVCVYGGVSYNIQQNALSHGVDVVVGTPGRIIDLINNNCLKLSEVQYLVLDEADQMLAVGFEEDVEVILEKLPSERQSMLFSATMPGWVKKLARKYLDNPLTIDLVGDQDEKLAEGIKLYAITTTPTSKRTILSDLIMVYAQAGKTIVFTRTKRDADEVSMTITNNIVSEALHGDISQHQRERTLNGFRQGKFSVLVATDVAARGLDIPNVDLVIHYELPNDPETFVHRSGRTGRAGKEGSVILMLTSSQRRIVKSLERAVGCSFEFIGPPAMEEVLKSSAEQVVATLNGVHPESVRFFVPMAQKLIEEQGAGALAAALAHLSGFSQPPSSRSHITLEKLPTLEDNGPHGDNYGRFSNRQRGLHGGSREKGEFRGSYARNSDDEDVFRRKSRNYSTDGNWSRNSRRNDDDWLISSRRSNRSPSFGSRDRSFGGACFKCGQSGHKASECLDR